MSKRRQFRRTTNGSAPVAAHALALAHIVPHRYRSIPITIRVEYQDDLVFYRSSNGSSWRIYGRDYPNTGVIAILLGTLPPNEHRVELIDPRLLARQGHDTLVSIDGRPIRFRNALTASMNGQPLPWHTTA